MYIVCVITQFDIIIIAIQFYILSQFYNNLYCVVVDYCCNINVS